ncbi:hypothetical protein FQN53_000987 [Emmonsiellopsis sp. PD_33]|nr:hypothetical protein FQN53_000987 [Emmonsiellopsis sp. PD_33]
MQVVPLQRADLVLYGSIPKPIENTASPPPEATVASSRELPEAVVVRDNYPEVVPQTDDIYYYKSPEGQLPVAPDGAHENVAQKHPPERGCSNLRSRTLLVTIILAIIAIAAIIGGSVGGTLAKKHGEDYSSPRQNASNNAQRAIAAANCSESYIIVYQQPNGSLDARGYSNVTGRWFSFHNTTVESPRMGTPISVVWPSNTSVSYPLIIPFCVYREYTKLKLAKALSIFYVSKDHILQMSRVRCYFDLENCESLGSSAIADVRVSPNSSLVAYSMSDYGPFYIAVLDDKGKVFEIWTKYPQTAGFLTPLPDFNPHPSSPLAAAYNDSAVQLYWINKEGYLEGSLRNETDGLWSRVYTTGWKFPKMPGSMVATNNGGDFATILYTEDLEVRNILSIMGTVTVSSDTQVNYPTSNVPFGPIAIAKGFRLPIVYVVDNEIVEVAYDYSSMTFHQTEMEPIPWTDEKQTIIKV